MVAAPSVSRRRLSSTPGTARYSPPKIKLEPRSFDGQSAMLEYDGTLSIQASDGQVLSTSAKASANENIADDLLDPLMTVALAESLSIQ